MSGTSGYTGPNFGVPYVMPPTVPANLADIIRPIYISLQNIIQTVTLFGGLAPRNAGSISSILNDGTSIVANNSHRFYTQSSENIAYGAMINLYASGSTLFVRNANATTYNKPCDGFCSQSGGLPFGTVGEVILSDGVLTGLSGLTVGSRYYLGLTDGSISTTAPVGAGKLSQEIGIAISTTLLRFWTWQKIFL